IDTVRNGTLTRLGASAILRTPLCPNARGGGKMPAEKKDVFGTRLTLQTMQGSVDYYSLRRLEEAGVAKGIDRWPYSLRILLENLLRNYDGYLVTQEDIEKMG